MLLLLLQSMDMCCPVYSDCIKLLAAQRSSMPTCLQKLGKLAAGIYTAWAVMMSWYSVRAQCQSLHAVRAVSGQVTVAAAPLTAVTDTVAACRCKWISSVIR
jgi:hypothetical protein